MEDREYRSPLADDLSNESCEGALAALLPFIGIGGSGFVGGGKML